MTAAHPDPADPQVAESLRLLDLIVETARTTDPVHLLLADESAARDFAAKALFEDWRATPAGAGSRHLEWEDLTGPLERSRDYWLTRTVAFWPVLAALRALVTCPNCEQADHTTNRCPQPPI